MNHLRLIADISYPSKNAGFRYVPDSAYVTLLKGRALLSVRSRSLGLPMIQQGFYEIDTQVTDAGKG
jgi:hypothetical protein